MDFLDKTFWRMALGFTLIIIFGLAGVYLLASYQGQMSGIAWLDARAKVK